MISEIEIALLPEEEFNEDAVRKAIAKQLKTDQNRISYVHLLKRSIDARGKQPLYRVKYRVYIDEQPALEIFSKNYPNVTDKKPVLIIGAGPAGLFAALRCIENG